MHFVFSIYNIGFPVCTLYICEQKCITSASPQKPLCIHLNVELNACGFFARWFKFYLLNTNNKKDIFCGYGWRMKIILFTKKESLLDVRDQNTFIGSFKRLIRQKKNFWMVNYRNIFTLCYVYQSPVAHFKRIDIPKLFN